MMKLKVLSIIIFTCNTTGFVSSGSKLSSYFGKLDFRKELNRPQMLLDVDETCLNKQTSQR